MLIDFITSLIILSFAFRIILMLAAWPFHLVSLVLFIPVTRGRVDRAGYWASLVNPVILAAFYGGFIAMITAGYSVLHGAKEVYLIVGAVAAFFSLVSYAEGLRAKAQGRLLGPDHTDKALWIAASASLVSGLAAFVLFYLRPHYIMLAPGADIFFQWVYGLAEWLRSYQIVQIILAVAIIGYILFVSVWTVINAFRLALGGLKRLLQRLRWWLKPAPAEDAEDK